MTQVIIGDIIPYTQAIAIASQTVFGTNWTANVASDVVVYQTPSGDPPNDVTQILQYPADYSVSFIGSQQEVQVTLTTPASAGDRITIIRNTPADRMNLYTNTNFTPTMLNNDFGILTLVDQQAQLVDQKIGPRYNYSAIIVNVVDTILPVLPANSTWIKNSANTAIETYVLPQSGIAPADASYVLLSPDSDLPNSQALSGLGANSILAWNQDSGLITATSIIGTANQITVVNGDGNGTIALSIPNNPIMPGTAGIGIPIGTTAQRVTPVSNISLRYNTDLAALEFYDSGWFQLADTSVNINPGLTNQLAYYAADGSVLSGLPTANNGVLVTSSGGAPSISSTLPSAVQDNITRLGTVIAGTWNATPIGPVYGGTGLTSYILGDTLYASGVNTLAKLAGNTTAVKQYLSQTGTGVVSAAPIWSTIDGGDITGAALTKTDDTNVTLTLGGSPTTALLRATSLTLGWSGQLAVPRGGTGAASFTAYAVLCGGTTSTGALQNIASVGTSGQVLTSNGAGALPSFQTLAGSGTVASGTINQLAYYAATGTTVSGLATANNGVLVTDGSGVPSISSTLPAFTTSSITFSPTTGGIVGTTTNDNAAAGKVGEVISSAVLFGSAVSLTTATATNITSISLTAGDWDVYGGFRVDFTTNGTEVYGWTSTTSATLPDASLRAGIGVSAVGPYGGAITPQRLSLSGTTTVYLSAYAAFTTGTTVASGLIWARRAR